MRSLIRSRIRRDDSGAVLVVVAVMMVALLGMGALVIDVGQLYVERRELQNGADAAALAVAQDCADGDCDETATAQTYANDNAKDGKAGVDEVCGSVSSGLTDTDCDDPPAHDPDFPNWVKVDTVTPDDDQVDFVFAPILGHDTGTSGADAVAAWGSMGKATTLPLTFSKCEYNELGGNVQTGTFPHGLNYIYFHDTSDAGTCKAGPSGADLPGGFGWLAPSGTCGVEVTAGGWVNDKTGNGVPNVCQPSDWRNREVLVPIYDDTNDLNGSNGRYHVAGFAGFRVHGYRFPGNEWDNGYPCGPKPKGGTVYLCGEFTQVATPGDIDPDGDDYGAHAVQMVG